MAQRFEGRNLDEALDAASKGLGVERYQVSYGVVLEKRGFLGGTKRVVIEASINESAEPQSGLAAATVRESAPPPQAGPPRASGGERSRSPRRERGQPRGRDSRGGQDRPPR